MTEKLEKCRCGENGRILNRFSMHWADCTFCTGATPPFDTDEEAIAAWNRMQSAETFTRKDMIEFGDFIEKGSFNKVPCGRAWREATMEQRFTKFLAQRRK